MGGLIAARPKDKAYFNIGNLTLVNRIYVAKGLWKMAIESILLIVCKPDRRMPAQRIIVEYMYERSDGVVNRTVPMDF